MNFDLAVQRTVDPRCSRHCRCRPAIVEVVSDFNFGLIPIGGTVRHRLPFSALRRALRPQLIVPGFPYPFTDVTHMAATVVIGGWWLDETPVPQPVRLPLAVLGNRGKSPRMPPDHPEVGARLFDSPCPRARVATHLARLSGTWYREIEGAVFSATFSGDEMKLCMTQRDEGARCCFTITADYAITKEGLVHGVVTGVDVEVKLGPTSQVLEGCVVMPPAAITAELQKFVDSPFSFRTKTTSAGVMVSNLKFAAEGMDRTARTRLRHVQAGTQREGAVPKRLLRSTRGAVRPYCEVHSQYPPVAASPLSTGTHRRAAARSPPSMPVVPGVRGTVPPRSCRSRQHRRSQ